MVARSQHVVGHFRNDSKREAVIIMEESYAFPDTCVSPILREAANSSS